MGIWTQIKSFFTRRDFFIPSARKLDATSEPGLAASIMGLPPGVRGWITMEEAQSLFSPMETEYAFGEMDDFGRSNLATFAAKSDHRAEIDFRPAEGRIYFIRQA
jgi:hypothetical protein